MSRLLPLLLCAALAGCHSCPDMPDMPQAPQVVEVPVKEYVIPAWLVTPLPEDKPRANTVEEATRLACVRLGTIHVANCRARLGESLRQGRAVDAEDIAACEARAVSKCEVRK